MIAGSAILIFASFPLHFVLSVFHSSTTSAARRQHIQLLELTYFLFPYPLLLLHTFPMSPTPEWVKKLKPSGPQGSEMLQAERDQSNVAVGKLADLLHTREVLERQQRILKILQQEKVFDKSLNHSLGRVERIKGSLAKAKRLQQLKVRHGWSQDEFVTANDLVGEPNVYGLHASMFLVSICLYPL